MEMKASKRSTEIGPIPCDWGCNNLGELTTKVGSGITPRGGESVYKNQGRPFLRSQNIGWGRLHDDDIAYIDEETHRSFDATEVHLDDVLLNITGASIGRSALADRRVAGGNVNQHVCIIRTEEGVLDPSFLNQFLLSERGQYQVESFQAGGNRQGLNFGQIRAFVVPVPPLSEQRAIADALSDVDALIERLDALISKKQDIKKATMQRLLTGRQRLPGFSGYLADTRLGAIPSDWTVSRLGDVCSFENGDRGVNYPSPSSFASNGVPFINAGNLSDGRIETEGLEYITREAFARLGSGKVKPGDILFCLRGSIGKFGVVSQDFGKAAIASSLVIIRPDEAEVRPDFLGRYFSSDLCAQMIDMLAGGGAQPNLGAKDLGQFMMPLPPLAEQEAISSILSDMDAEIEALQARRDKTKDIKQGMMQELLTGRTRLV
jgi:type I restriction enzyme S subunit